jgi:hypothetical protein
MAVRSLISNESFVELAYSQPYSYAVCRQVHFPSRVSPVRARSPPPDYSGFRRAFRFILLPTLESTLDTTRAGYHAHLLETIAV